jgi:GAF domain-containing protein
LTEIQTKRELEQLANELAILQEIAIDLSSGLELPEVLNKAVNYAARLTNADGGFVFLYEKNKLTEFHPFNLPSYYPWMPDLHTYIYQRVFSSKQTEIIEDYQRDIRADEKLKKSGLTSMMVVPILSGADLLGLMELLQFDPGKKFSEQDARVLEILTRHAAITIENARYLKNIRAEASFRKVLSDFSADINSSLELRQVLYKFCERTVQLFELGGGYISLADREKRRLDAGAAYGLGARDFLKLSVPLTSPLVAARVAHTKKTLVANDFGKKEHLRTFLAPLKPKSAMFVPLLLEGSLLGVAVLMDLEDPEKFDRELVAKIETLAGPATTAIRNAQLYEAEAKSKSFISSIFHNLPAIAVVLSVPDYRILETNERMKTLVGEKRKLTGRYAWDLWPELSREEIGNWLNGIVDSKEPFESRDREINLPGRGRTRWDFIVTPNLSPMSEDVETITLLATETTEEFRLRNALEEAMTAEHNRREELEAVISGMNAGVSIYDAEGKPVFFNEFTRKMVEDEKIKTRSAEEQHRLYKTRDARTGEELSGEDIPFARALREKFSQMEVMIRTGKGNERFLSVSGASLKDKSGGTLGVVLVSHDVTPLRQAQKKLESSLRTTEILLGASKALTSSLSLKSILDKLAGLVCDVAGCSRVGIALHEPHTDEFVVVCAKGIPATGIGQRSKVSEWGEGFRRAYEAGRPFVLDCSDASLNEAAQRIMTVGKLRLLLILPFKSKKGIIGHAYADEPGRMLAPSATEIKLLESIAGQAAVAIEKASLYESEIKRAKQLEELQRFVVQISKEKEPGRITRVLCESARKLLGCRTGIVSLLMDGQWSWPYFSKAKDFPHECTLARTEVELPVSGRPYCEMMETKKPLRMVDVFTHPLSKGLPHGHVPLRGLLGVPLLGSHGEFLGQLMLSDKADGGYFTEDDESLLVTLARQTSIALEKAQAYQREHRVATVLQESLLTEPSAHPELEVSLLYRAATDVGKVGGDFYDFFDLEEDLTAVIVGDIAGKGIQAAALTAMAKNFVRAYAFEDCKPATVLARTNRALCSQVKSPDFVSLIYGLFDRKRGTFAYGNAGHPWPMVLENRSHKVRLATGVNLPLGIQLGEKYREHVLRLKAGDRFVLYTDGVTEIRKRGKIWGEEGLQKALFTYSKLSCSELSSRVLKEILEFSGGRLSDDIIILILRWIPRRNM